MYSKKLFNEGKTMNLRKLLLWFIFIDFAAFSAWVMWHEGYMGIWQAGFVSSASLQILLDLAICCFLICSWIKRDAEERGVNPYPWIIATLLTGSIAPLVYLIVREYQTTSRKYENPTLAS